MRPSDAAQQREIRKQENDFGCRLKAKRRMDQVTAKSRLRAPV